MNRETFRAMIRGLIATIIEKEVVLGEADAKESVLTILYLLEDLDLFWNSDMEFEENAEHLQQFIDKTREKYTLGGN
ncbi:hypothetical protein [Halalkalibacter okhensis]|uniref:Uncharacterized protein n=1 Tax=Halalkalibacter okhensis TaxID=333138 RepID=A0A0B0IJJ0_9BACI|nr:hypothetical protein [Halalkalibacter okhensis]KHF41460.1 hypothetical protein LQ50_04345 [Halalkalibacter okhensis]